MQNKPIFTDGVFHYAPARGQSFSGCAAQLIAEGIASSAAVFPSRFRAAIARALPDATASNKIATANRAAHDAIVAAHIAAAPTKYSWSNGYQFEEGRFGSRSAKGVRVYLTASCVTYAPNSTHTVLYSEGRTADAVIADAIAGGLLPARA